MLEVNNLSVAYRDASVEGGVDGGVAQRVWTDVSRDTGGFRDAGDHAVRLAPIDGACRTRAEESAGR